MARWFGFAPEFQHLSQQHKSVINRSLEVQPTLRWRAERGRENPGASAARRW